MLLSLPIILAIVVLLLLIGVAFIAAGSFRLPLASFRGIPIVHAINNRRRVVAHLGSVAKKAILRSDAAGRSRWLRAHVLGHVVHPRTTIASSNRSGSWLLLTAHGGGTSKLVGGVGADFGVCNVEVA